MQQQNILAEQKLSRKTQKKDVTKQCLNFDGYRQIFSINWIFVICRNGGLRFVWCGKVDKTKPARSVGNTVVCNVRVEHGSARHKEASKRVTRHVWRQVKHKTRGIVHAFGRLENMVCLHFFVEKKLSLYIYLATVKTTCRT